MGRDWKTGANFHNEDIPTRIEEVANPQGISKDVASITVPLTSKDFHGDALDGQVAVVRTNGMLGGVDGAPFLKQGSEVKFVTADMQLIELAGPGARHLDFEAIDASPSGLVGGSGVRPTGIRIHLRRSDSLSPGPVSENKPCFGEAMSDGPATDPQPTAQGEDALACQVALDEIVSVEFQAFHGQVYNLSTVQGYYLADGILTSNCQCQIESVWTTIGEEGDEQ